MNTGEEVEGPSQTLGVRKPGLVHRRGIRASEVSVSKQVAWPSVVQLDARSVAESSRVKDAHLGGVEPSFGGTQEVAARGPEADRVARSVGHAQPAACRWCGAGPGDVIEPCGLSRHCRWRRWTARLMNCRHAAWVSMVGQSGAPVISGSS
jgi:hypothetical protein